HGEALVQLVHPGQPVEEPAVQLRIVPGQRRGGQPSVRRHVHVHLPEPDRGGRRLANQPRQPCPYPLGSHPAPPLPVVPGAGTSGAVSAGTSARARAGRAPPSSTTFSAAILSCRRRMPCSSASGRGGQPGTYTSTGMIWSTPLVTQ